MTYSNLNWIMLYFLLGLYLTYLANTCDEDTLAKLEKKLWMKFILIFKYMFQVALYSVEIALILGFWISEFKGYDSSIEYFICINYNAIIGLVLFIDVCFFNREIIYLKHIWLPVKYCFFYYSFDVIYVLSGGKNQYGKNYVYKSFDWKQHPKKAILHVFFYFIGVGSIHFLTWIFLIIIRSNSKLQEKDKGEKLEAENQSLNL
jgi:hypothetical protein